MLTQRRQIAAKIETVEGTAETLAAVDADLLVFDPKTDPDIAQYKRDPTRSSLSQLPSLSGKRSGKVNFKVELKGSGAAGTAPSFGKLLKACGFSETIVAGISVTYKPASTSISSLTLGTYEDSIIKKLWGARGNVKLSAKVGESAFLEFSFEAADFSVTDGAMLSPTYENTLPQAFLSAALSLGGYAAIAGNINIDMANKLTLRESMNSSSGYFSTQIVNREPKGSLDPEMVTVATHDFFGKWRSGATAALSLAVGAIAGNICTISAPKIRYTKLSDSDKSGIAGLGMDFDLAMDNGDDELSLVFT